MASNERSQVESEDDHAVAVDRVTLGQILKSLTRLNDLQENSLKTHNLLALEIRQRNRSIQRRLSTIESRLGDEDGRTIGYARPYVVNFYNPEAHMNANPSSNQHLSTSKISSQRMKVQDGQLQKKTAVQDHAAVPEGPQYPPPPHPDLGFNITATGAQGQAINQLPPQQRPPPTHHHLGPSITHTRVMKMSSAEMQKLQHTISMDQPPIVPQPITFTGGNEDEQPVVSAYTSPIPNRCGQWRFFSEVFNPRGDRDGSYEKTMLRDLPLSEYCQEGAEVTAQLVWEIRESLFALCVSSGSMDPFEQNPTAQAVIVWVLDREEHTDAGSISGEKPLSATDPVDDTIENLDREGEADVDTEWEYHHDAETNKDSEEDAKDAKQTTGEEEQQFINDEDGPNADENDFDAVEAARQLAIDRPELSPTWNPDRGLAKPPCTKPNTAQMWQKWGKPREVGRWYEWDLRPNIDNSQVKLWAGKLPNDRMTRSRQVSRQEGELPEPAANVSSHDSASAPTRSRKASVVSHSARQGSASQRTRTRQRSQPRRGSRVDPSDEGRAKGFGERMSSIAEGKVPSLVVTSLGFLGASAGSLQKQRRMTSPLFQRRSKATHHKWARQRDRQV